MSEKMLVKIKDDAWVEEKGKRLTGEHTFDKNEAQRLINLGVAEPVVQAAKIELPTEKNTVQEILAFMQKHHIPFGPGDTKKVLLEKIEDWNEYEFNDLLREVNARGIEVNDDDDKGILIEKLQKHHEDEKLSAEKKKQEDQEKVNQKS